MHLYTAHGVVLNKLRYLESDFIVTLFLKTAGKLKAIVKGGANSKKRFPAAFEAGNIGEFGIIEKNNYQLAHITHAKINNYLPHLKNDYEKVMMLFYILGITDAMLVEHHKHSRLFEILIYTLQLPDWNKNLSKVRLFYELNLLKEAGLLPAIEKCEICGNSFNQNINFLEKTGKLVCDACIPVGTTIFRIPDYLVKWINAINRNEQVDIYDINHNIPYPIFDITKTLMSNYIDKPLKIWKIINTIQ